MNTQEKKSSQKTLAKAGGSVQVARFDDAKVPKISRAVQSTIRRVAKRLSLDLQKAKLKVLDGDTKEDPAADLRLDARRVVKGLLKSLNATFKVRLPGNTNSPVNIATSSSTVWAGFRNVDPVVNAFNWSSWASLFDEYKLDVVELHYAWTAPIVSGVVSSEVQPLQMAIGYDPDTSGAAPASMRSLLEHVESRLVPVTNTHPVDWRIRVPPFPAPAGGSSVVWCSVTDSWPGCVQEYAVSPTTASTLFGTVWMNFEVTFRFRA